MSNQGSVGISRGNLSREHARLGGRGRGSRRGWGQGEEVVSTQWDVGVSWRPELATGEG